MKSFVIAASAFLGSTGVLLGALGAHALKKILSHDKLSSFEVGVRYQIYHALALLAFGMALSFRSKLEISIAVCWLIGTLLFSFSIYLLSMSDYWGVNFKSIALLTPLGGTILVMGWLLLFYYAFNQFS